MAITLSGLHSPARRLNPSADQTVLWYHHALVNRAKDGSAHTIILDHHVGSLRQMKRREHRPFLPSRSSHWSWQFNQSDLPQFYLKHFRRLFADMLRTPKMSLSSFFGMRRSATGSVLRYKPCSPRLRALTPTLRTDFQ